MDELKLLKKDIEEIKRRNKRVELEKAWETSITRKCTIIFLTYLIMVMLFTIIKVEKPFINAIIPTLGYFLSTLSIGVIEKKWKQKTIK